MSDAYIGGLTSWGGVAALQQAAEAANAVPDTDDMTDSQDGSVRLEGEAGQTGGFGAAPGDRVPNLNVTRVSKPCVTRGLPSNLQTNPLGPGRGR